MATTIQLLRSSVARQRPDPGLLTNGVPMVNLNESEPGLFFSDRAGTLFKVGPVAIGDEVPNSNPEGESGNSKGEAWLDTSGSSPILRVYDGSSWVACYNDPGGTVISRAYTAAAGANQLPAGTVGQIARVTDASAPAIGSTVSGGGASAALCWYNGSNWTVIGV